MSLVLWLMLAISELVPGHNCQSRVIARPCCVPSHFRCVMDVTGGYTDPVSGKTSFVDSKVRLYNDYELNVTRTDTDVTLPSGVTFVHSELTYYNQHISYKIDGRQCRTDRITALMQDKCIPDDATLLGTNRIGQSGHKSITVDTWHYVTSNNITILRAVTVDQCWPVYQTEQSVYNGGFSEMAYMINNIELGEHPDLIVTPNTCSKT
ncbi:uncharacterized protein LOC117328389 [Pecten maximus]|uniref:uncharacterized protein LOC117328389 n=1 Tax=Pecten maximus TaxID=6579 RepID=UPI001458BADD|nr:uncharacterized protein LOC117328389 [Pecten maximus]